MIRYQLIRCDVSKAKCRDYPTVIFQTETRTFKIKEMDTEIQQWLLSTNKIIK